MKSSLHFTTFFLPLACQFRSCLAVWRTWSWRWSHSWRRRSSSDEKQNGMPACPNRVRYMCSIYATFAVQEIVGTMHSELGLASGPHSQRQRRTRKAHPKGHGLWWIGGGAGAPCHGQGSESTVELQRYSRTKSMTVSVHLLFKAIPIVVCCKCIRMYKTLHLRYTMRFGVHIYHES